MSAHPTNTQDIQAASLEKGQAPQSHAAVLPDYTIGEEIANAVSHGFGAVLSVAGLVLLIVKAVVDSGRPEHIVAAVIFGMTLVLEYTMSTLYHAITYPPAKRVLRTLDHSCIFLLIAGSYTPFTLGPLLNQGGVPLMVAVWLFALIGIGVEVFLRERQPRWVTITIYLVMGWLVIFRLPQLLSTLQTGCLALLVAGGLCYTIGTAFYLLKRVRYMHSVWHLWVLAGSVCQFLAVLLFVL